MIEVFISKDGTQFLWNSEHEKVVNLVEEEINLLKYKVNLMTDYEILNQESGNGVPMGIPVYLRPDRIIEIKEKIIRILKDGAFIDFEEHAISRIVEDSFLDPDDPRKRGWNSKVEAEDCILHMKKVIGVRLNVDHRHPENTEKVKHLHQQFAIVIEGKKKNEDKGRLVLVILNEGNITVVTVL